MREERTHRTKKTLILGHKINRKEKTMKSTIGTFIITSIISATFLLQILMFETMQVISKQRKEQQKDLEQRVRVLAERLNQPVALQWIDEDDVRKLNGSLEAHRNGNVLHFRSFAPAKSLNTERTRIPISGGITNVMDAMRVATVQLGEKYMPLAVVPEVGVYEGKLALMSVVVTVAFSPQK